MLALTHTITSAAVGTTVQNAPLALSIAFLLHLFLDTFTHWNFYTHRHRPILLLAALDLGGGLALTVLLLGKEVFAAPVLAAILGGNLPDIITFGSRLLKKKSDSAFMRFHERAQWETYSPAWGMLSQAIAIVVSLVFFRR
jgi:hypothetical protein